MADQGGRVMQGDLHSWVPGMFARNKRLQVVTADQGMLATMASPQSLISDRIMHWMVNLLYTRLGNPWP